MTGPLAAHALWTNSVTETGPIRWGMPLANTEFDRRHELRVEEVEALKALSPLEMRRNRARGLPRRTAAQWKALARLVEPLDECASLRWPHLERLCWLEMAPPSTYQSLLSVNVCHGVHGEVQGEGEIESGAVRTYPT